MRLAARVALPIFAADQATKAAVLFWIDLPNRLVVEVLPPFLVLRMAWNTGVNFGLLSGGADWMRWVLIAVALGISAWVWHAFARADQPRIAQVAAGVLVGGAIGNVVDRVLYGAVADFLNMSCCGLRNPYSFNIADIAIFIGVVGLVLAPQRDKTP